jgi:ribosomal protein S18 acetylase RimI-like enzyme
MNNSVKKTDYIIRPITYTDFESHLILLSQLTDIGKYTKYKDYCEQSDRAKINNTHMFVMVMENKQVVCGTLLVESKIIHQLGQVGHIEDIVVDKTKRGQGLGKIMIDFLTKEAKLRGCYKTILNCKQELVGFYQSCGYTETQRQMSNYFK